MRRLASTTVTLAVLTATVLAGAPPASAAQLSYTNTRNNFSAWAAEADVVFQNDGTVDARNVAIARNQGCTGCRTGIVAFQLVVVTRNAPTSTPYNYAEALNVNSFKAFAFADARQVVVNVPGATGLSREGREELAELNRDLDQLDRTFTAGATGPQLIDRLNVLEQHLRALSNDLTGPNEGDRPAKTGERNKEQHSERQA